MKKIITFLVLGLFLFSTNTIALAAVKLGTDETSASASSNFLDVSDYWASEEINFVAEKGLMKGYPDNTFKPEQNVSRLELAVVLDRVFEFNFAAVTFIKQPELKDMFDDVDDGQWYSNSLLETTFFGVLKTEDRKFHPNRLATRMEVAKAIQQAFRAKNLSVITTQMFPLFKDTQNLSSEESSALSFVFNTSIMKGRAKNYFGPTETITRAELAVVLKRTMNTLAVAELSENNLEIVNPPLTKF